MAGFWSRNRRDLMTEKIGYAREINPKEGYTQSWNKSCFFILPLLGFPMYWYYGLINCYLGDETNKPEFTLKKIFIQVNTYDSKLTELVYFNQFYKLEDNTYMYIYDIPTNYEDDYMRFYKGKYSEMSESAKSIICRLSGVKPIMNSVVYKVLYRTLEQRIFIEDLIGAKLSEEAEVYSIPNLDKEIYSELSMASETKKERESGRGKILQTS